MDKTQAELFATDLRMTLDRLVEDPSRFVVKEEADYDQVEEKPGKYKYVLRSLTVTIKENVDQGE